MQLLYADCHRAGCASIGQIPHDVRCDVDEKDAQIQSTCKQPVYRSNVSGESLPVRWEIRCWTYLPYAGTCRYLPAEIAASAVGFIAVRLL